MYVHAYILVREPVDYQGELLPKESGIKYSIVKRQALAVLKVTEI